MVVEKEPELSKVSPLARLEPPPKVSVTEFPPVKPEALTVTGSFAWPARGVTMSEPNWVPSAPLGMTPKPMVIIREVVLSDALSVVKNGPPGGADAATFSVMEVCADAPTSVMEIVFVGGFPLAGVPSNDTVTPGGRPRTVSVTVPAALPGSELTVITDAVLVPPCVIGPKNGGEALTSKLELEPTITNGLESRLVPSLTVTGYIPEPRLDGTLMVVEKDPALSKVVPDGSCSVSVDGLPPKMMVTGAFAVKPDAVIDTESDVVPTVGEMTTLPTPNRFAKVSFGLTPK